MYEKRWIQEAEETYSTNIQNGLTEASAVTRLSSDGKNELEQEEKKSIILRILEQMNDPLIAILLIAAGISILLKEYSDAGIVFVVIVLNTTIGLIQEGKAQQALDALKKLTSPHAVVRRGGVIKEIPAEELVTGDIVILESGMQVPADLLLIDTYGLLVEESALTGETLPVEKNADFFREGQVALGDRKNQAFMSTLVVGGRGSGIVTATGMQTEIGKIAAMIKATPKEFTPLQKKLAELGKILSALSVFLCAALFGIAVLQHRNILEMLITAISLAVAAVPEGLPATVTIVLAMSVSRMVKINTIIRKLPAVETLGSVNIVCSDKTGTLTQNKMTVTECYVNEQNIVLSIQNIRQQANIPLIFLKGFILCNNATETTGAPTEKALFHMAAKCGINQKQILFEYPRIEEKAFDSTRKMMTTVHRGKNQWIAYTKGAPDYVLKNCTRVWQNEKIIPLTESKRREIQRQIESMSGRALRVIALAMQEENISERKEKLLAEKNLIFIGLAGMKDPIRPEAKAAIETFRKAAVRTIMITGDYADTAVAIAKELNLIPTQNQLMPEKICISGEEIDHLSDEALKERLQTVCVFARVSPEHKVRIVRALKSMGNIVAMTGDGVNDAPSLRIADIGIAMGKNGTDVAKNASDMILADDNFATIRNAIEEGREIYKNIKKTVLFLLSSNFGEIITMFLTVLCGLAAPLKAAHILWINLITDSLPALALGADKNDRTALMNHPPRGVEDGIFSEGGLSCTIFYGCLIAAISLAAFLKLPIDQLIFGGEAINLSNMKAVLENEQILARAQTYAFTVLGMSQLFHAYGMRDVEVSVFSKKREKNYWLLGAFLIGFFLQFLVTEVPFFITVFGTVSLSFTEWISLMILSAFPLLAHEILIAVAKVV